MIFKNLEKKFEGAQEKVTWARGLPVPGMDYIDTIYTRVCRHRHHRRRLGTNFVLSIRKRRVQWSIRGVARGRRQAHACAGRKPRGGSITAVCTHARTHKTFAGREGAGERCDPRERVCTIIVSREYSPYEYVAYESYYKRIIVITVIVVIFVIVVVVVIWCYWCY